MQCSHLPCVRLGVKVKRIHFGVIGRIAEACPTRVSRRGGQNKKRGYRGFNLAIADDTPAQSALLADGCYDAEHIRQTVERRKALTGIPNSKSHKMRVRVDQPLYRLCNLVDCCSNKLKKARHVAIHYDKTSDSPPWLHPHHGERTEDPPFLNMTKHRLRSVEAQSTLEELAGLQLTRTARPPSLQAYPADTPQQGCPCDRREHQWS